jgi:cell wall-associated NlpC family hydrolase
VPTAASAQPLEFSQPAGRCEVNPVKNPGAAPGIAKCLLISLCTNSHKWIRMNPAFASRLPLFSQTARRCSDRLTSAMAKGAGGAALTLGLLLGVGAAQAAPVGDTVTRFLRENQLLDAALAATQTVTQTVTQTASDAGGDLLEQVRDGASDLVINAMNFLGVPYRRGGNTAESGFDCSGFTRHVFENSIGLLLPRRSAEQANASGLLKVQKDELRPGDLVFFNTMRRAFSHVGIYIGDGKFVHAPRTGQQIKVEDMRASYWTQRFNGARRAGELGTAALPAGLVPAHVSAEAEAPLPQAMLR